ncbi:MAG: hypothetical protein ACRDRK_26545 [Pseudonocardia sp.]
MTAPRLALDLDWTELDRLLTVVAEQIRAHGIPDVVVGVLRGGMVPAVVLAHRLGTRAVRGLDVTHTLSDAPTPARLRARWSGRCQGWVSWPGSTSCWSTTWPGAAQPPKRRRPCCARGDRRGSGGRWPW